MYQQEGLVLEEIGAEEEVTASLQKMDTEVTRSLLTPSGQKERNYSALSLF